MNTMTEDEARKRWCPMARVSSASAGNRGVATIAVNGDQTECPSITFGALCIAAQCMAWRWAPDDDDWVDEQIRVPGAPSYTTQNVPPRRGYCGAFGRPDE